MTKSFWRVLISESIGLMGSRFAMLALPWLILQLSYDVLPMASAFARTCRPVLRAQALVKRAIK